MNETLEASGSGEFQKPRMCDAVPHNPGKRELGETVQDSGADGRRADAGSIDESLPAPLAAELNPQIGGAELTNGGGLVALASEPCLRQECGQRTTYQQASNGQSASEVTTLSRPKDKSVVVELEARPNFTNNETSPAGVTCYAAGDWFIAADIARAVGTHKKKIHRLAKREGWPVRQNANRLEYQPPARIAELVLERPRRDEDNSALPTVKFGDLVGADPQRQTVLWRQEAVELLANNVHLGKETALQLVCRALKEKYPIFKISVSSLRRWADDYRAHGLDGLVEQKRGRVGRKAFALDLETEDVLRTGAASVEYGIKGRLNVARGYRRLVADPTVGGPGGRPTWLHSGHASKSYVPPSVRAAVKATAAPITVDRLQLGPRAAKLRGPYSECSYENVPAGRAWTADDMTANVYVWVEWPNPEGFLLIRPQILAVMDIGSMSWLNVRAVIRPRGQYNKDDVWGLIGDTLDAYGLHVGADGKVDSIAVLEGGTWQSNVIKGYKTGLSDEERVGGLQSLGVKVIHTRTPHGKIIETAFNSLQHAADNCEGFCGRMEMRDCPEDVKSQLAAVRAGKAHPRSFFKHFNDYTRHLVGVMNALNNERNDGRICRGASPSEKWGCDAPSFAQFPDNSKWLYRATYSLPTVSRNGVRVTLGSGKYQLAYTYTHEALEQHRGSQVVVFWNDYNPDTKALVYTIRSGKPHQLICAASRMTTLPRFGASEPESHAEAARKKLSHNLAVSQSASLAPYLERRAAGGGVGDSALPSRVGQQIDQVRAEAEAEQAAKARVRSAVRRVEVAGDDLAAAVERNSQSPMGNSQEQRISDEEIADIFAGEKES